MWTVKILDILLECKYIEFIGNNKQIIKTIVPLTKATNRDEELLWCSDKNLDKLTLITKGTVIVSDEITNRRHLINTNCNYIIVNNPRSYFREILVLFFSQKRNPYISENANIHPSVTIGTNVFVGNNVILEENCKIGNNCEILHNTVILSGTIIGDFVKIGCNNTIGGIGFGYEKDDQGDFQLIPHLGNVVLKDFVEIGNNSCVDRAVLGSTILEENVKVDNLVHIAHGVIINRNSVIIANSMIAGSVEIGANSWVSPSASILNQTKIGKNTLIGMGAVVIKDIDDNDIVVGNPSKSIVNK